MRKKSRATVIVVDDDASIRRALSSQLQILGFNVLTYPAAEDLLASELPTGDACLLVDVYMPGMRGTDLSRTLIASGRPTPTILMSAHDDLETRQLMQRTDAVASLFKPFDENALLRAIRKALRHAPAPPRSR